MMASWPVGTLPGTIINACPSTTPVVVAIITSLSRWTSAKSSVHRRSVSSRCCSPSVEVTSRFGMECVIPIENYSPGNEATI